MTGANSTAQQTPACISDAELFMDELLEDPSLAQTREERRRLQLLTAKAEQNCLHCPLLEQCLYDAVVKHEVAGYCAGTTQRQRQLIRHRLNWRVDGENLDIFAGVHSGHQIDHDEVLRLRQANPTDSLESIALRLGCSLSTVKRHLRKERRGESIGRVKLAPVSPSVEQVMAAYQDVMGVREQGRRAA